MHIFFAVIFHYTVVSLPSYNKILIYLFIYLSIYLPIIYLSIYLQYLCSGSLHAGGGAALPGDLHDGRDLQQGGGEAEGGSPVVGR